MSLTVREESRQARRGRGVRRQAREFAGDTQADRVRHGARLSAFALSDRGERVVANAHPLLALELASQQRQGAQMLQIEEPLASFGTCLWQVK